MKRTDSQGFTAIEAILAAAILSGVGLMIGLTFTRTNRLAEDNRQMERAAALGEMALAQYDAIAALGFDRIATLDRTKALPHEFFGTPDDLGYDSLRLTTKAESNPEDGTTRVTVRVSWGAGLFPPSLQFVKVYPHWMGGSAPVGDSHAP